LEDKDANLWQTALNMDMMIYGGEPLPPDLKAEAMKVKEQILDMINRCAGGEF
jgi:hypothetical protein